MDAPYSTIARCYYDYAAAKSGAGYFCTYIAAIGQSQSLRLTSLWACDNFAPRADQLKPRIKKDVSRIAGAGICCLDRIFVAPQVAWSGTARVEEYRDQGGGLVGTALVTCARLGAECFLFSFLSHDEVGAQVASELAAEGIKLEGVAGIPQGTSPFSFIHVDSRSGERTIFHRPATGLDRAVLPDLARIAECDVLLVDDYYPDLALAAAGTARRNGIPVVADVTVTLSKCPDLFREINVLIAPRAFAAQIGYAGDLTGALQAIHRLGPETAIITLGREGYVYSSPEGQGRGKAFKVAAVDTTGAGDAFHGAFAYGLARRWEFQRCAEFAAAVAAIKCTKPGGRTGLPTLPQIIHFLIGNGRLDWSDLMSG
jgi:sugar/nucleoside kinase (ribokinase family)